MHNFLIICIFYELFEDPLANKHHKFWLLYEYVVFDTEMLNINLKFPEEQFD